MRLEDFLNEVGRYRQGYLKCAASIADLRLSGVFRLEDTDKLLAVLPRTLPVQLRYRTRRSEEHTSELQSLMRISYAVFCLKKKNKEIKEDNAHQADEET